MQLEIVLMTPNAVLTKITITLFLALSGCMMASIWLGVESPKDSIQKSSVYMSIVTKHPGAKMASETRRE